MSESDQKEKKPSSIKLFLREADRGKRLIIGLILLFFLTFFVHFREVRIESLDVDSTASRYIVAQVDFDYPDEESTLLLRQKAIADIGSIYKIDEKEVREQKLALEKRLSEEIGWQRQVGDVPLQVMYEAATKVEDSLLNVRLTDPRTLQKMAQLKADTMHYVPVSGLKDGVTMQLPNSLWDLVDKTARSELNSPAVDYVVSVFSREGWTIEEDSSAERALRLLASKKVKDQYSRVKAGSPIVEQGEKVTTRHATMMQGMKKALSNQQSLFRPLPIAGSFLFALIVLSLAAFYFKVNHKEFYYSVKQLTLYATIVILTLVLSKVTEYFLLHNTSNLIEVVRFPIFTPFVAILLCILISTEISLFTTFFLTVIISVSLAFDHTRILTLNFIAGIVAIIATRNMRKRKEVFAVCGKVWLATIPILIGFNLIQNQVWSIIILTDLASSLIFLFITAILVVGVLPIFESIFHVMTDITLMEYMDPSNELLRRLTLEAPGTYQHCLVVGSLAEAAANAIGANGLFCRVATMYHDIGKLFNPHYFTENQMGGFNIHQLLTPLESTQVIIAHVPEGVALAKKNALPQSFIDIIEQHHGTTLVYYFYCKQVEQMEGDVDAVDETKFRYPGPKPRSKESAIIMIADTIEAASRSLEEVNEEALTEMVDRLVADKAQEGQFDECQLTFEELGIVKKTIVRTLAVTRHLRVKYPDRKR